MPLGKWVFAIVFLVVGICSSRAAVGAGKTYAEALANARFNSMLAQNARETGKAWVEAVEAKQNWHQDLANIRSRFWSDELQGEERTQLADDYARKLMFKDYYFAMIHWANTLRENPNRASSIRGYGDAIEALSGGKLDGGIEAFADRSFDKWAGAVAAKIPLRLIPSPKEFLEAFASDQSLYSEYRQQRDMAEFLFHNPASPLRSSDSADFLAGWLLATYQASSITEAESLAEELERNVGQTAVESAVAVVKSDYPFEKIRAGRTGTVAAAYIDWLLSRNNPDRYGAYLIKRWMRCDWQMATKLFAARKERVGEARVMAEVAKVMNADKSPVPGNCFGNPYEHLKTRGQLEDCVGQNLGLFTLWHDAYAVALQEMDRNAARLIVQDLMAKELGQAEVALRYARLTNAISESVLLAGAYIHRVHSYAPFIGKSADKDPEGWRSAEQFLNVLEGISTCGDDRTFALIATTTLKTAPKEQLPAPFTRLENAIRSYEAAVQRLGVATVMAKVKVAREKTVWNFGMLCVPDPSRGWGRDSTYEYLKIELGGGAEVADARRAQEREQKVKGARTELGLAFSGAVGDGPRIDQLKRLLADYKSNKKLSDWDANKKAGPEADEYRRQLTDTVIKKYETAVAANELHLKTNDSGQRKVALQYKAEVVREIENAYKLMESNYGTYWLKKIDLLKMLDEALPESN